MFYQVYPRSFACAENPEGIGDLRGLITRLDHIVRLGADAIWLSPVFSSPQVDHGYDVSDYFTIDPIFGTMADFDELLEAVHSRGLRLLLDLVPNHTSDQHEWFMGAVAAGRGSPQRARYLFRDGRGPDGDLPPTDVVGSFSGASVWTRVIEPDGSPGQWYFHLFTAEQPDLNWAEPAVLEGFEQIWRYWLDKGVDGFRVDVADHLTKDVDRTGVRDGNSLLEHDPGNRTHQVWRAFREVLDGYQHEPTAIGEIWSDAGLYGGAREFPLTFAFPLLKAGWDAAALRTAIEGVLSAAGTHVWVIDNHDTPRSATRLGSVARSRALTLLMLALPGAACLYQGQELGLPNVDDLPDEVLTDPIWQGSGRVDRGRDGCRVPLPWEGAGPPFGFSTARPWLPQPARFAEYTVQEQNRSPSSTLSLTRAWVGQRRQHPELHAGLLVWLDDRPDRLHFGREFGEASARGPGESAGPTDSAAGG